MVRYESTKKEEVVEIEEGKFIKKPPHEAGYKITRALVRDPSSPGGKRLVKGWKKTRVVKKNKVGGMTTAQRRLASKKAQRTKKANPAKQRKALKKAKITRKKSKQAGLSK